MENKIFRNNKAISLILIMSFLLGTNIFQGDGYSLCNMNEEGLEACKPSVTQPDPVEPSAACCNALSAADLACLCSQKGSPMLSILGIDPALAMALPKKCSLTPPENC